MSDNDFFDSLPNDMDIAQTDVKQSDPIIRAGEPALTSDPEFENDNFGATSVANHPVIDPTRQAAIEQNHMGHVSNVEVGDTQKALQIPQISIQVFYETPATAQLLQTSASDRRMARSHITLQAGGIIAAKNFYQDAPTPNLIIIESRLQQDQLLSALDDLASVCDAGTKVFIMGHQNDIQLYRELISRGISDYLVLPTSPLNFIETVYNIYHDPESAPLGKKFAFFGAKGGVGSSTIAHNVAHMISHNMHDSVTIVDMDFAFGTLGLNFNQDASQDILGLLKTPERIDEATINKMLIKHSDNLNLLPNISSIEQDNSISSNSVSSLLGCMTQSVANSIIDLPHIWNDWVKSTLIQADQIVITATPDLACLRNTKNIVDYLKSHRTHDKDPMIVMNQLGMTKKPEIKSKDFADAIGVKVITEIAYDPRLFGTAANNGQMIEEFSKADKALDHFSDIAQNLMSKRVQQATQKKGLLDLFKKKA
ncbi:MAG: AAA family ATPase [Rhizobiales bacterium]|nr:AAA family ATPase [Hyphomicrobiales bacterium]